MFLIKWPTTQCIIIDVDLHSSCPSGSSPEMSKLPVAIMVPLVIITALPGNDCSYRNPLPVGPKPGKNRPLPKRPPWLCSDLCVLEKPGPFAAPLDLVLEPFSRLTGVRQACSWASPLEDHSASPFTSTCTMFGGGGHGKGGVAPSPPCLASFTSPFIITRFTDTGLASFAFALRI